MSPLQDRDNDPAQTLRPESSREDPHNDDAKLSPSDFLRRHDPDLELINRTTEQIIACAIEVQRVLGPGLLESIYEEAICIELGDEGIPYTRQVPLPVFYKQRHLGLYRIDIIVNERVPVEIKSVERLNPVFGAQMLTYLRLTGNRVGLVISFNSALVRDGIKRFIL